MLSARELLLRPVDLSADLVEFLKQIEECAIREHNLGKRRARFMFTFVPEKSNEDLLALIAYLNQKGYGASFRWEKDKSTVFTIDW